MPGGNCRCGHTLRTGRRKWTSRLAAGVISFGLVQVNPGLGLAQSRGAEQTRGITLQLGELLAAGKITQANAAVEQYLSKQPASAQTFFEVGRVYFEHDQWKQASDLLHKSLELQSQNDVAHLLLGLSLAELKQYEESEQELQIAVQQNPRSDFNWYFAGWRLLLRGKYEASLPYFYKAAELNPRNPNAQRALGSRHDLLPQR